MLHYKQQVPGQAAALVGSRVGLVGNLLVRYGFPTVAVAGIGETQVETQKCSFVFNMLLHMLPFLGRALPHSAQG